MSQRRSQRAFTVIELCLGLVITTLVMGALAAFSLAMTTAWKSSEKSQALTLMGNQASVRLDNQIRQARLIGACRKGTSNGSGSGAAVLLWTADSNGDGLIQGNEVALIEHDPATHTLRIYPDGQADALPSWSHGTQFMVESTIDDFKTNRTSQPMLRGVYGAIFETSGTSGIVMNPSLSFALKLMVNDSQAGSGASAVGGTPRLLVQYGTATVRAPLTEPGN